MSDLRALLHDVADRIADHREGVGERPVAPEVDVEAFRAAFGAFPEEGVGAERVLEELVAAAEPALVGTVGPRYFGFVVGGALDAATGADMLASGWDQVAFNAVTSPAAALIEEVAGRWLKEALGLPANASFGLVTGAQAANTVCLAAARHRVLAEAGWDVERDGVVGAPPIAVVASEERHATIDRSLRLLGLGEASVHPVAATSQGAIDTGALAAALRDGPRGPTIVCLQAGNVNTGAFDDVPSAASLAHDHDAWVHVDGAFGLWATASPRLAHLVEGLDRADSWAVDGHKWLNLPYDTGFAFVGDPDAHAASMWYTAAYLQGQREGVVRTPSDYVPESSRRARGFAAWAALRELGRDGLAQLVDRCCELARRFADGLGGIDGVTIGNEVVLNQVLVAFDDDDRTDRVVAGVQREGTCWMGGTTWHGRRWMRISVSNATTTTEDVDLSIAAIRRVLEAERAG